ncbi:glycosyltransferase [Asticcacaulis tiandongensis]|uniref:glycosyltransferase n=1 Tax=Asticcacaulis tiandongensis TaxID=2565365 RepID=UPI00112DF04F|nr:glycosyltransferase [Asticcacaulis tiandongensis]
MIYILNPHFPLADAAIFELRTAEYQRQFHLSIRPREGTIILNRMVNDQWQDEVVFPFSPSGMSHRTPLFVELKDDGFLITIRDQSLLFPLEDAHISVSDLEPVAQFISISKIDTPDKEQSVKLFGRDLIVPKKLPTPLRLSLVNSGNPSFSAYLGFLSNSELSKNYTVIDLCEGDIGLLLSHALLRPDVPIISFRKKVAEARFVEELIQLNKLENVKILPFGQVEVTLSKHLNGTSPLLIQGDSVYQNYEHIFIALNKSVWPRLSLFTREATPIPSHRLRLDLVSNLNIDAGIWQLNHTAHNVPSHLTPGLDVVVAAYNANDFLIECVESLLCNDRDDVRIIVVNDGSTDGSEVKAQKHFANDPRVIVASKPNGGCASARNYGRLISDRTHIAFVDADDLVSDNFFADLYDLALYTGNEIVQAGFDIYDTEQDPVISPSYEDKAFEKYNRQQFGQLEAIWLNSQDIIKGQPTIWRRVYRRDFLDNKKLYFPENIRAYDDYIFHITSLNCAGNIWMLPAHKYHYRQHAAQDIKAGDERHFYMFFMFGMLLRRSMEEGWPDFYPTAQSIMDSINWSSWKLRPDLVDSFLKAAANFCVRMEKTYPGLMSGELIGIIKHADFPFLYQAELKSVQHIPGGPFWVLTSGPIQHTDMLRVRQNLRSAQ